MIVVNYKSKRQLKKAIGESLKATLNGRKGTLVRNGDPFFVTNMNGTFKATVVMANGVIESVR